MADALRAANTTTLPAASYQGRMTQLEAINMHLLALGVNNISSFQNVHTNTDAYGAFHSLMQTSREVQLRGWHFNTLEDYKLTAESDGTIVLPANSLRVETSGTDFANDLVERDGKLYSNDLNSFVIGGETYVRMVMLLQWETIPEVARWYITVKSIRRYVTNRSNSQVKNSFTKQDEQDAKVELETQDSLTRKGSMKRRNKWVQRMRGNRGQGRSRLSGY